MDDKDLTNNNICGKGAQVFKTDDASVHHPYVYKSFLNDSPVCQLRGRVLRYNF